MNREKVNVLDFENPLQKLAAAKSECFSQTGNYS